MNFQSVYQEAQLALAAYALQLSSDPADATNKLKLKDAGMSDEQATEFLATWDIVASYESTSGASATVFRLKADQSLHVAVRGTELQAEDFLADGTLALGVPAELNPQFIALKEQVQSWIQDGVLPTPFSLSGHSLGGYLAVALKSEFSTASAAYQFNSPGVGGVFGSLAEFFTSAFGQQEPPGGADVWNIQGTAGGTLVAGTGYHLSEKIGIRIEDGINTHSIVKLVDALAVETAYARMFPTLSVADINRVLNASGTSMTSVLESALDYLRAAVYETPVLATPVGNREKYFENLKALSGRTRRSPQTHVPCHGTWQSHEASSASPFVPCRPLRPRSRPIRSRRDAV